MNFIKLTDFDHTPKNKAIRLVPNAIVGIIETDRFDVKQGITRNATKILLTNNSVYHVNESYETILNLIYVANKKEYNRPDEDIYTFSLDVESESISVDGFFEEVTTQSTQSLADTLFEYIKKNDKNNLM